MSKLSTEMTCKKSYLCQCLDDTECIEMFSDVFGSTSIQDGDGNDLQKFRDVCNHFDKFGLGHCLDKKKSS